MTTWFADHSLKFGFGLILATKSSAPLPTLPVITRARVDVVRDGAIVIEDVAFSRGDWSSGDVDVYVSFGAPGTPRAFDARLVATTHGNFGAALDEIGEALPTDRASNKPEHVVMLLGSSHMAGEVIHLKEPALRRSFAGNGTAVLRVRSLIALPPADSSGFREVVVRLGASASSPLALSNVEVGTRDASTHVASADAHLCGPDADSYPIAVHGVHVPLTYPRPTSPLAIVRHASDDLCVRWSQ